MAKFVIAVFRDNGAVERYRPLVRGIGQRIIPDNIVPNEPVFCESDGLLAGLYNPNSSLLVKDANFCLGGLYGHASDWWRIGTPAPDGSYALVRSNAETVEFIADAVGSRTIWYYMDDGIVIASSSQRAIVTMLGDYQPNPVAATWMLSSGTLGPGCSWDQRIKAVRAREILTLDRRNWILAAAQERHVLQSSAVPVAEYRGMLNRALDETFRDIGIDHSKWAVTLSGGIDSRLILMQLLGAGADVRCITWGLAAAMDDQGNDASVARVLAEHYQVRHEYYETDVSDEPVADIFLRYLVAGEGRIDHVSGYMDGFKIWKEMAANGIHGIIRGDEAFCWPPQWPYPNTPEGIRRCAGGSLLSDYNSLDDFPIPGRDAQAWPDELERKEGESDADWRYRVYLGYRHQWVYPALNDLKNSYVEVINPLLSRRIIDLVAGMPADIRSHKKLLKELLNETGPDIAYASRMAPDDRKNVMKSNTIVAYLRSELDSDEARTLVPAALIEHILCTLSTGQKSPSVFRKSLKTLIKKFAPASLLDSVTLRKIDPNLLAFRVFIIKKMNELLIDDAAFRQGTAFKPQ